MHTHVLFWVTILGECLVTFHAVIWFPLNLNPDVSFQMGRLRSCFVFFTFIAWKWFISIVDPKVTLQVTKIEKICGDIPGMHMASPQCEYSCDSEGGQIGRMFGYIPCRKQTQPNMGFMINKKCMPPNMVRLGPFSYLVRYMVRYHLLVRFKLFWSDLLLKFSLEFVFCSINVKCVKQNCHTKTINYWLLKVSHNFLLYFVIIKFLAVLQ